MWMSAADLIEKKGRATAFAAAVGYSPGAVRQWAFRGIIPRVAWPNIQKAFDDVTLDDLLAIERRGPPAEADRTSAKEVA